jgi:hypothetical protein
MTLSQISVRPWAAALFLATLAACGGGRDPVLGFDGTPGFGPGGVPLVAPTVAATIPLGRASTFGAFGGSAGMTNTGVKTVITGDIGTTAVGTAITGFHDKDPACTYTEVPAGSVGDVQGVIYADNALPAGCSVSTPEGLKFDIAKQAEAAALAAYNELVAKPMGPKPGAGNLAGLTLTPGVYTSAEGFLLTGGDLTLDAQGDPNAVWVFQMGTTLTVGAAAVPSSVILANGAQAGNVFWQVGSAATLNPSGGGTFVGTIISKAATTVSTVGNANIVTINGRLLSLTAVTLVNTVINVP